MTSEAYLIDTHAALWWWGNVPLLGAKARKTLEEGIAAIFISATSAIEIGIKYRIGKMPELGDPEIYLGRSMQASGFSSLPVTAEHALRAGLMPGEHRDPFDRIIAAQSLMEGLSVITRDPAFAAFGCKVVW